MGTWSRGQRRVGRWQYDTLALAVPEQAQVLCSGGKQTEVLPAVIHGDDDHRAAYGAVCFQLLSRHRAQGGRGAQTSLLFLPETWKPKLTLAQITLWAPKGPVHQKPIPSNSSGRAALVSSATNTTCVLCGLRSMLWRSYHHVISLSYFPPSGLLPPVAMLPTKSTRPV